MNECQNVDSLSRFKCLKKLFTSYHASTMLIAKTTNKNRFIAAIAAEEAPDGLLDVVVDIAPVDEGRGTVEAAVGNCVSAAAVVVVVRVADLVDVRDCEDGVGSEVEGSQDAVRRQRDEVCGVRILERNRPLKLSQAAPFTSTKLGTAFTIHVFGCALAQASTLHFPQSPSSTGSVL